MPETKHDNLKFEYFERIRKIKEDYLITTEYTLWSGKEVDLYGSSGRLLIEIKVGVHEFEKGLKQLKEYAKEVITVNRFDNVYGILAWDMDKYKVYIFTADDENEVNLSFEDVVLDTAKDKIPLTAENFKKLFDPLKNEIPKLKDLLINHKEKINHLYKAYKNALELIYKGEEEKIQDMFSAHTLLQMVALSCLSWMANEGENDVSRCTGYGKSFNVSLPFLEWWYYAFYTKILNKAEIIVLEDIAQEIGRRIRRFNWELIKARDVFRLLYESYIEEEDRRKFGEYYTPLWLVKITLDRIGNFVDKIVIDPFCGSGTFLVEVLRRKIEKGRKPEDAVLEVAGFDLNPLAVLLTRAEILLSFWSYGEKGITITPLVFYVNSAEALTETKKLFILPGDTKNVSLYQMEELLNSIHISKFSGHVASLGSLIRFEYRIRKILQEAWIRIQEANGDAKKYLKDELEELENEGLEIYSNVIDSNSLYELIKKYGDGVWSISIASLFAFDVLRKKIDFVVSNPPWINLTELEGDYGKGIRGVASEIIGDIAYRPQIIQAGNIASVFLWGWNRISKINAFVMPESVTYDGNLRGAGKILTEKATKGKNRKFIRIDHDAFMHGEKPSIVISGKGKDNIQNLSILDKGVTKDRESVKTKIKDIGSFGSYIDRVSEYFKTSRKDLTNKLNVHYLSKQGTFVRGLFGGEKKTGKIPFAGLAIEGLVRDRTTKSIKIKLWNTKSYVEFDKEKYITRLIYRGFIFPFSYSSIPVLLSEIGVEDLKKQLRNIKNQLHGMDRDKVKKLIEEVQQGKPHKLEKKKWYVLYRRMRTFTAFAIEGDDHLVPDDSTVFMNCKSKEQAFYYAAVLNYLVFKAKKGFVRDQFARPLLCIYNSSLQWQDKKWQKDIAQNSDDIHKLIRSKKLYKDVSSNQIKAYMEFLLECKDTNGLFNSIIKILDGKVQNLDDSLNLVRTQN